MTEFKTDHRLFFYHIEKTAGMTFNQILLREYGGGDHVYHLHGKKRRAEIAEFEKMPKKERLNYYCFTGHMSHLLAKYLPQDELKFVVFLREPTSQVLSSYNYVKSIKRTKAHDRLKDVNSLEDYLDWQVENRRDNIQCRYLADAVRFLENKTGPINMQKVGRQYLEKALHKLDELDLVFITEDFDDAILVMEKKLKWPRPPYYAHVNKSKQKTDITPSVVKKIREIHKYDFELYEAAKEKHYQLINSEKDWLAKRKPEFKKQMRVQSKIKSFVYKVRLIPGGAQLLDFVKFFTLTPYRKIKGINNE